LCSAADLEPHVDAQLRVEVGERLVEQEDRGLAHDGAADGDALALAAGEVLGRRSSIVDLQHVAAFATGGRSRPRAC
jgi:hypothetical protein